MGKAVENPLTIKRVFGFPFGDMARVISPLGQFQFEVGFGEFALGNESDVFRDVGMRRAGPLAIDHAMKIIRPRSIGRLHSPSFPVRHSPSIAARAKL